MGLSDIMRGSTEASETATAQSIKAQYGSVRIRDKQEEIVRVARELTRICAEIIAENFSQKTIEEMCQMDLPTNADIEKQIKEIEEGAKKQLEAKAKELAEKAKSSPELAQQAQQHPEQAQAAFAQMQEQIMQQAQQQIERLSSTVTIDQVMEVLRDQRIRPFTLDIETDSTIQPDEQAEKQARNEFMGAFTQTTAALGQLVSATPEAAPLAGAMLKFVLAPYRAGRELNGQIDTFVEALQAKAQQPQANPQAEALKAQAENEQKRTDGELEVKRGEIQLREHEMVLKAQTDERKTQMEMALKTQEAQTKQAETAQKMKLEAEQAQRDAEKHRQEMEMGAWEIEKLRAEVSRMDTETAGKAQEQTLAASVVSPVVVQGEGI
jgi:hypothetical protein